VVDVVAGKTRHEDVEHHGVGRIATRELKGPRAIIRFEAVEARVGECRDDDLADGPVVVDDEHALAHVTGIGRCARWGNESTVLAPMTFVRDRGP